MYRTGRESPLDRSEAAGVSALADLVMSRKPIMTRRLRRHEDHVNHEAWAIPYGDLVTLLLAFFVVMYAISSVNAGKYRVLSDSLFAAFRGTPRSMQPLQVGTQPAPSSAEHQVPVAKPPLNEQGATRLDALAVQPVLQKTSGGDS